MSAVWPEMRVEDICSHIIDYRGKTPIKTEVGIRLITAKVVKGGEIREEPAEFIAEEYYDEWMNRGLPKQWDVLITTEAPLGETAIIRTSDRVALGQRLILLRGDPNTINQRYLLYNLQSKKTQARIAARATGTTVLGIKQSELRKVVLSVPPLKTQHRIASILGAYDDLIEVNRRRIAVLEEMARRLFEEWFVHFRFPGHKDHAMVETPDGFIPRDWQQGAIADLFEFKSGFPFKSGTYSPNGTHRIVTIRNVQDGIFDPNCESGIEELPANLPAHCHLTDGSLLLSLTGNVGRVCIVFNGPFLLNQRVALLSPVEPNDAVFAYCTFRQTNMRRKLELASNGVAQQNLSPIVASKLPSIVPPAELRGKFAIIVRPIFICMVRLMRTQTRLAVSRDAILPRLISGELSLSTAERELEAVA